jgi:hypothetical protein
VYVQGTRASQMKTLGGGGGGGVGEPAVNFFKG